MVDDIDVLVLDDVIKDNDMEDVSLPDEMLMDAYDQYEAMTTGNVCTGVSPLLTV
jgi:hypothetical protein